MVNIIEHCFVVIRESKIGLQNKRGEFSFKKERILPQCAIHLTKSLAVTLVYAVIPERCSRGHISIYAIIDG